MSKGIPPRILNLSTVWRCVVSFTPWPSLPRYQLDRGLGEHNHL